MKELIGYEIFHCILREEFFHLTVELAGQSFVMGYDQGGLVKCLNDIRHRESLTRTGHAKQGLKLVARFETLDKFLYGLRLITGRLIFRV